MKNNNIINIYIMSKSNFTELTRNYIKNNFDNLVGKQIEIEIEDAPQKIIIYKDADENGDAIDYSKGNGDYFMYLPSETEKTDQPRPISFIDLSDFRPGAVKINIANPQSGNGRRKRKTKRKRKTRRKRKYTRKKHKSRRKKTKKKRRKKH